MKHEMHLEDYFFQKVKNKTKEVEYRLYDVKRRAIKKGDIITFTNRLNNEKIDCLVKAINVYQKLDGLLNNYNLSNDELSCFNEHYHESEIQKYGIVAIELEKL